MQTDHQTRLQKALSSLPDVDKVKLMSIAHTYGLDPEDPAFLAVVAVSQGVEALEASKKGLAEEVKEACELVIQQSRVHVEKIVEAEINVIYEAINERMSLIDAHLAQNEAAIGGAINGFTKEAAKEVGDELVKSIEKGINTSVTAQNSLKEAVDKTELRLKDLGKSDYWERVIFTSIAGIVIGLTVGSFIAYKYASDAAAKASEYERLGKAVAARWSEIPVGTQKLIAEKIKEQTK